MVSNLLLCSFEISIMVVKKISFAFLVYIDFIEKFIRKFLPAHMKLCYSILICEMVFTWPRYEIPHKLQCLSKLWNKVSFYRRITSPFSKMICDWKLITRVSVKMCRIFGLIHHYYSSLCKIFILLKKLLFILQDINGPTPYTPLKNSLQRIVQNKTTKKTVSRNLEQTVLWEEPPQRVSQ